MANQVSQYKVAEGGEYNSTLIMERNSITENSQLEAQEKQKKIEDNKTQKMRVTNGEE